MRIGQSEVSVNARHNSLDGHKMKKKVFEMKFGENKPFFLPYKNSPANNMKKINRQSCFKLNKTFKIPLKSIQSVSQTSNAIKVAT